MKKPVIFGVYGESKSGKTTLIVKLIKQLNINGFKVATVKITDKNVNIDKEGKDTWKHSKAGAKLVVLSSPVETDFLLKQNKSIDEIIKHINKLDKYDYVIVEGAYDNNIPKIRLGNIEKRENTILTYNGDFNRLIKIIKNKV